MRILNKMKKTMLVLAASLFCANVAFAGEVALTADMFKTWDSVGADAVSTGTATPEMNLGTEIGGGAMVYGYGTVDPLAYADLSGYEKIVFEGTPGVVIRVLMNRELGGEPGSFNGALVEVKPAIGEDGKAEVDLTSYAYVHLNAMKLDWGSATGTITKIALVKADEPALVADTLKLDVVNELELGKTYIIGASGMHKVSFTAPADGFLNLTTSQRINRTGLKINGATSTFTNENGGFSKKGMAEGSIFEGQFYVSGTPSAENTYSFILTFEEGVPYEPITLSEMYPADGGEWSAAAYYWPNLTSYQGQPYLSFSLPINTTSAVASVKIGEKVYSPLKLYVSSQRMTLQSLPDTLKAAVAEGLIKPGESFQITLTGVEDKEFSANKLADLTFSYTLASTACTGVTPVASTSRTELPQEVVFSFDGEVKIDNAKFFFIDGTGKEIELTGATVEGSSVKIPVTGIEGLLPKTYDIVAKGVTNVDGKVITYGNTVGQLTASYGTSNGYFKPVASPANYDNVASLKTYTFTLPANAVFDATLASDTISFSKLNEETYSWEAVEGVTPSYEIKDNVVTVTLSKEVTAAGDYRLSVPAYLFWSEGLYDKDNLTKTNCYYMPSQNITCTILPYGPTTVTPASGSTVNKLGQIVLAFDEPVDFDAEAKAVVNMMKQVVDDYGWPSYMESVVGEFALAKDDASKNNVVLDLGNIDSAGIYSVVIPEGAIWTVADNTKKIGKWAYEYEVDPEYQDATLVAAVETLNALIAEVEAYQKTLDLTDPMSATMNQELTTVIADAKAVAEAAESLEAVKNAEGYLNSVYVSVVGGVAGAVIGEAEEVMASYENPTDEAGLGAAIQKVYEIYSSLGTGMGDVAYTVSDLVAAVEAVKVAQEAFIVENTPVEADDMAVVKSWDFAAMADTMSVSDMYMTYSDETVNVGGTASNLGTGVWEGLAMQGANKFYIRTKTGGLYQGNGGGRKVGILDLVPGQKVTIVTDSECFTLNSTDITEQTSVETADGKTTYVYTMTGEGTLALTMTRYFNIFSITVEQKAAMVQTALWDFAAMADTMTVSDMYMTYSDETVNVGGTASNIGTGVWEGLAMQGANKFYIRTKTGGLYSGNGGGRKVGVLDLKKASVVTIVTDGECMSLADATVAEETSKETVDGKTTYVYTMTEDGTLALTMTRYFSIFSIKVESLVKYVAAPNWDFAAMADTMTVSDMYMTYSDETVKVGGTASNLGTGVWEGLAMQGANKFFIRTQTGGLYSGNGGGRKVGVLNLTAGSIVTIVTDGECMSLADATNAEQTSMETVDGKTTYVYTMTGDGILALTMTRYFSIFSINVLAVQADIKAPTIDATKNTDDVVTVTLACETKGAVIYYSIDGGADSLYNAPFQVAKTSLVQAYSVSADGKNTSKVTEKEIVAGFINVPTATITAVDGVNRTVSLASATEGASIIYATSALEEVALTKEMFHKWDGVGADANQTADATTPELGVGVELGAGGMVYGYSTVDYLHYADLTGAVKLVVEGTPGVQLRVLMNRVEHEGALTEVNVTIGTNGKAEVDLTGMEYVHLNAIKTGWGSAAGTITKLAVASVKEGFEAYTEPFVISDNTTVWAIASKKSAIADSLTFASDTLVAELVAGTEVALNAPTFAKAVVDSLTQIEYAEKGLAAFMITSNQSSVLCAPTAKISYEFFALNQETGRVSETADLSGEYTDTLKALPYGLLKATASAEGYKSTESHIWLKVPVELTPIWTINFDSIATAQWVANDSADLIVDATYRDFVFNGKFRANMSADFKTASFGDSVLNNNFVLHDGQDWELRYRQGVVGLYNNQSGDRGFGFANLKKNQVIHVHYSDPAQAIFMDGPIVQDAALTDGNDVYYTVTGDGNASIAMNRYYYITKVGVYMNPALTQIPDFAITKVDGTTHYVGMTTATKGADIYYAIGHEEYSESQVLVNDTTGGVAPEYATKIDTTIVYGESKLYTEPVALDKTSYVRAYAWYQDVESEAREELIEAGMTVQIAQPVILYTGNNEAGEKQFTITVDNSEVISTPTTPIYYTLPGAEEALYDGGTITVKADAYGWMTAVAKLAGYEDSKAARRYIDARESYTEKYEVVDATLETIPAEAGDVEIDYSEDMNVEQLGATAFAGRVYFHRVVEAAVINVSLPTVFNNNCYVTDAAGNKLERGVDYVINEIKAAERPIDGVLTGNMAATAAKGYVVNFLNADLKGKEVIFVSAVKGNIAKGNFTYAQPEAGYKVVTNRTFAAATLDVPAYVLNAEGTAFELVENGAVVAPFQSVILASADICATVGSLSAADGIESIAADKEVKEIKYFTVGGVEVEKPAAGVYIQQIIFTDGTVKNISVAGK